MSDGVRVSAFPATHTPFLHAWWQVMLWSRAHIRLDTFPGWDDARRFYTRPRPGMEQHHVLAEVDGAAVGAGLVTVFTRSNHHLAAAEVSCLPAHRRRGVGTALILETEHLVAGLGRTTVLGTTIATPGADSPGLAFGAAHGYDRVGREEVKSADLATTAGRWDELEARSSARAAGYRLVWWADRAPEELVEPACALFTRFLAEVPLEGVDLRPDPWDAERLRADEQRDRELGRHRLVVAARTPDGALAGYSDARLADAALHRCGIDGTLVLPEHRGHSLGLALKVRLHRLIRERWPACERVITGNAGVNTHMNAVNDLLGYEVVEEAHELQKVLPA